MRGSIDFQSVSAALIIHPVLIGIHGNVDFVARRLILHDRAFATGLFAVDA